MGTRLLFGLLTVLLTTSICCSNAESQTEKSVFVSGKSHCLDCAEMKVETGHAYEGLQVAIKCKTSNGDYKIKGCGKLDKDGGYKVQLPAELIGDNGELKQECFAQLHSVTNAPCPGNNGLKPSKLVFKLQKDGVHSFSPAAKLPFSSTTCTSAFFWPHSKFPPLSTLHSFHKPLHKLPLPPFKFTPKPYFHPIHKPPIYKPHVPIYKPHIPIYKPLIKPPVPIYKSHVPIYKPPVKPPVSIYKPSVPIYKPPIKPPIPFYKPHVPIYKPPVKPSVPIYKPPVSIYKPPVPIKKPPLVVKPLPPPVPIYKPNIYKKPCPPLPHFPPIYKKPLPPLPKFPPIYKKPYHHFPKYPPMYKKPPHT